MVRAVVVVQQRMGSTRFPGKAKVEIAGMTLTEHVCRRCLASGLPTILATPFGDDFSWARWGLPRGYMYQDRPATDENDVLGRYVRAVGAYVPRPEIVVRVTGDCLFVMPQAITAAVAAVAAGAEYAETRSDPSTRPNGLDVQAFTRDLLMRIDAVNRDREHMTTALRANARTITMVDEIDGIPLDALPPLRLCLDTQEDYEMLSQVASHLTMDSRSGRPDLLDLMALYVKKPDIFLMEAAVA